MIGDIYFFFWFAAIGGTPWDDAAAWDDAAIWRD